MNDRVADAPSNNWVYKILPTGIWPYAQLARWDRPIGWQLLFMPCALALALASQKSGAFNLWYLFLFFIGAVMMRGAGCTYNDIVDRHLDEGVERTKSRPLPSKRVSVSAAIIFTAVQALIGLIVLLQFNLFSIFLGLSSILVVLAYPFMKRITYWPQFVLGLAFSWGALMGFGVTLEQVPLAGIALYLGCVAWTIGYDTIYALQDIEDDELIGVKSTARLFGENAKSWIAGFYAVTIVMFIAACVLNGASWIAYLGIGAFAFHFIKQIKALDLQEGAVALSLFKSNAQAGLWVFIGFFAGIFY